MSGNRVFGHGASGDCGSRRRTAVAAAARRLCAVALAAGFAPAAVADRSGKEVYDAVCAACHASGVLNAPKFGDAKAWKPLIAEGQRMLTRTATRGIRQMPPRGGDPTLSDLEVARAVAYMVNASGGKFREPTK